MLNIKFLVLTVNQEFISLNLSLLFIYVCIYMPQMCRNPHRLEEGIGSLEGVTGDRHLLWMLGTNGCYRAAVFLTVKPSTHLNTRISWSPG